MNQKLLILITVFLGAVNIQLHAQTSFFTTKKINGKWHVIDPDGKIFHMRGVNHYGDGTHMPWNLEEKYATKENWRESVKTMHQKMNFTYIPPSIGPNAIDPETIGNKLKIRENLVTRKPEWSAKNFAKLDFPFTAFLEVPKQFMAGPDLPDVWSKEFMDSVHKKCKAFVEPLKNNKNLIGYHFCHNPPWSMKVWSGDLWIKACTKPNSAGLKEWIKLMQRTYGTIERWRLTYGVPIKKWSDIENLHDPLHGNIYGVKLYEDKQSFLKLICEQWYKVYHDAIRKYDKNHLLLGDRNTLHLQYAPDDWAFYIMKQYVDILSVNVMGPPRIVYEVLENATRNWTGPILLADTGAGIYESEPAKSAFQAASLEEFEEVYSGLVEISIQHPQIVGFGWCGYYEIPKPVGRSGLINVKTDEPLPYLMPIVKKWNNKIEKYTGSLNNSLK